MGIRTKIEWVDSTVNPIMGCTGCALRKDHCYAATLCERYAGRPGWPKSFDNPEFFPGRLEKAIAWRDLTGTARPGKPWLDGLPRHIFVNDMSDGFCPDADPWEWLAPSLESMHHSPHVWLFLTKWPDRMYQFFTNIYEEWGLPIPGNFYFGTSIENQKAADARMLWLSRFRSSVLFVSAEPMLEAIDLTPFLYYTGTLFGKPEPPSEALPMPDWVICGGESGPGARPMQEDWVRDLRDQCISANVPFFYKQRLENGHKVSLPELDGQQWSQMPGS